MTTVRWDRELLTNLLREGREKFDVPGTQLSIRTPEQDWHLVDGECGTGLPVTEDTAFPLGSLTKPFTATLVMMLVEDGDLHLDEPVQHELLPRLGPPAPGCSERLTVRRLLSHTSGLASDVDERQLDVRRRDRWLASYVREAELAHRPGSVFSYSNVGYLMLGHLVEHVTGMNWRTAVTEMLLAPLGITPCFVLADEHRRALAQGHVRRGGTTLTLTGQALPALEEPAGGLALSAADLCTLADAHLTGRGGPLDAATRAELAADQLGDVAVGPAGMADGWSLGWARYRSTTADWLGHDGTADGGSCHLRFDRDSAVAVAFTSNATAGIQLWEHLVAELRAAGLPVGHTPLGADPTAAQQIPAPQDCVGRFVNGANEIIIARDEQGMPVVDLGNGANAELRCFADLRFVIREPGTDTGYPGRFVPDPATGRIEFLQLTGRVARKVPDTTRTDGVQ